MTPETNNSFPETVQPEIVTMVCLISIASKKKKTNNNYGVATTIISTRATFRTATALIVTETSIESHAPWSAT